MSRSSLLSGVAAVACLFSAGTPACAQSARDFDIPAGPMRDALTAFGAQSGQQIFFTSDVVAGRRSPGVNGRMQPEAALSRLLLDSGLTWSQRRAGVFVVQRTARATSDEVTVLDEVVVTGTLLRSSGELASPVQIMDRDELDSRGRGTVAEALTDLPQNYAGSGTPGALLTGADRGGSNGVVATGINLRGLGADATLVLVNGRRLAGTGFRGEFADVSALPSAAVERVDILLDGASALYGSDAVGGVVNIIMRRSFDGQESAVRLSAAQGGMETAQASHIAGRSWSSGSALLSYEYQHQNAVNSRDRPYTLDGDLRPFGGSDWRSLFSAPGNIVAYDAASASYVSQFAIRPGPSSSAIAPTDFAAGETNLQSNSLGVDLIPQLERHSAYGRIRQSVGERLDLSADVRFSRRAYEFANVPGASVFTVTRANPFFVSPTGADSHLLAYSFSGDQGPSRQVGSSRSLGLTAGAVFDLGSGWSLDGYLAHAEERGEAAIRGQINTQFLQEALGNTPDDPETDYSTSVDGFFNPFGAGAANAPRVLDFISAGYSSNLDRSAASSVNLLLSGTPLTLPGGALGIAVGAQVRRESFKTQSTTFLSTLAPVVRLTPGHDRLIAAVFGEARIPLIGPGNARPGVRSLEVSIAGRVEDYEDFGRTSNPKVGAIWSPIPDLTLRGSWGTSFRAPGLTQLNDASSAGASLVPRPDGTRMLSIYLSGGNPDLTPETAETWTLGFNYSPPGGLMLSASYFDTRFDNQIARPTTGNLANVLIDPALSPFVRRVDPANDAADLALVRSYTTAPGFGAGSLFPPTTYGAIIDGRWINTASVAVRGLDLQAAYPMRFGGHTLRWDASASWLLDYDSRMTSASPVQGLLDQVGYPVSLRSRAGFTWSRGDWTMNAHWVHVSDYADQDGRPIDARNTADVRLTWSPTNGSLERLRASLGIQNLFDADPPFHDGRTGYGFDAGQANLLGRVVSLQLTRRW
ncbi:TonB-dependent receptor [Brevundimonas sp.]|uniref:TonB-dependent receptor n=1 Tax=Brevundimonas sp. TaxID=1871086 RepID=UPI0028972D36|nr:TonB-dependent receptor [Brevundimonas sp.]